MIRIRGAGRGGAVGRSENRSVLPRPRITVDRESWKYARSRRVIARYISPRSGRGRDIVVSRAIVQIRSRAGISRSDVTPRHLPPPPPPLHLAARVFVNLQRNRFENRSRRISASARRCIIPFESERAYRCIVSRVIASDLRARSRSETTAARRFRPTSARRDRSVRYVR